MKHQQQRKYCQILAMSIIAILAGLVPGSVLKSQELEKEKNIEAKNSTAQSDVLLEMLFLPGEAMLRHNCFDRVDPMIKHPANPVMVADRPWEGKGVYWPSVLYSQKDKLFRMWYMVEIPKVNKAHAGESIDNATSRSRTGICYAESDDGLKWRKPALNKILQEDYPGNNIVVADSGFFCGTTTVIEDPLDPDSNKRFKLLMYDHDGKRDGIRTAVSADGLNWKFSELFPILPSQDTPSLWQDQRRGIYQAFLKCRIDNRRARLISVSRDFVHWSSPSPLLSPDLADTATMNFYGQTAFTHHGADLGFLSRFDLASQRVDLELITASEGIHWRRLPGRPPILQPGDIRNSWDGGAIYPGLNGPIVRDDIAWFYYYGSASRHDEHLAAGGAIGIATFTPGRLAGQQFEEDGYFSSLPFLCPGGVLELDADARKPMIVQVCGTGYADGAQSGYETGQCEPISGNNGHHRVKWRTKDNLDELRGRFITLKISGVDSVVYGAMLNKTSPLPIP
jgi:hypothetical protein